MAALNLLTLMISLESLATTSNSAKVRNFDGYHTRADAFIRESSIAVPSAIYCSTSNMEAVAFFYDASASSCVYGWVDETMETETGNGTAVVQEPKEKRTIIFRLARPLDWSVIGDRGYKFIYGVGLTFTEAKKNCSRMGGRIAVMHTKQYMDAVAKMKGKHYEIWVGLDVPDESLKVIGVNGALDNKITWADGTAFVHQSWMPKIVKHDAADEATGMTSNHRCFKHSSADDLGIVDTDCSGLNQLICQSLK